MYYGTGDDHVYRQIKLPALFLCAVLLTRQGLALDPPITSETLTAAELGKLAEHRVLRSVEASYVITTKSDGELPNVLIPKAEKHVLVDLRNLRFSLDERYVTDEKAQKTARQKTAWDLTSYMTYRADGNQGFINNKLPGQRQSPGPDPFLMTCLLYPPTSGGMGLEDGSLISLLLGASVHKDLEDVDGRRCCVVDSCETDGTVVARAWLDVERSLAPLKVQTFDQRRKRVKSEWHAEDFVEISGGGQSIWFPTRVQMMYQGITVITRSISVDKNAIKVNPTISDTLFTIRFPKGTLVQDDVSKTTVTVGQQDQERKKPIEPIELRSESHWALWVNVFIIAIIGVLLLIRWRRRSAASGV